MSNRRRLRAHDLRAAYAAATVTAMQLGCCMPADEARCKQITHDAVIRQTGHSRASGVTWRVYPAAAGIDVIGRLLTSDPPPDEDIAVGYRGCQAYLTEWPDALLVIASVDVLAPRAIVEAPV